MCEIGVCQIQIENSSDDVRYENTRNHSLQCNFLYFISLLITCGITGAFVLLITNYNFVHTLFFNFGLNVQMLLFSCSALFVTQTRVLLEISPESSLVGTRAPIQGPLTDTGNVGNLSVQVVFIVFYVVYVFDFQSLKTASMPFCLKSLFRLTIYPFNTYSKKTQKSCS